jgi:SWI/SNF related-matrix-associated actin-dependent regulator of chromatin subfamily C
VTADTPRGLQPFQPGPNTFTTPGKPHPSTDSAATAVPLSKSDLNLEIRRNIYDDKGKAVTPAEDKDKQTNGEGASNGAADASAKAMETAAREPRKKFNCFSCGIDCTRLRFHYAKTTPIAASAAAPDSKYDLCPNCFLQGRMPSSHHASDFVKLEDPQYTLIPDRDRPWSNSETLLLLEGLENFDDNWRQISRHVGTRTPEECVLKFLQLEIEDKYLENPNDPSSSLMRAMSGREPISQTENPVLSVVTFLAQMAEPAVAAAAAGRSIEEIRRELRKQLEKSVGSEASAEKEKEVAPKEEDSMEVDTAVEESTEVVSREKPSTSGPSAMASVALATSAARSSALASHEEREMTRLVGAAVNVMLQKFELKLGQFQELETILDAERRELEQARLAFKKRVKEVQEAFQAASLEGQPEAAMTIDPDTMGITERYNFQPAPGASGQGNVQPLSAEGGDYKTFEL